jgi:hypothetical protein
MMEGPGTDICFMRRTVDSYAYDRDNTVEKYLQCSHNLDVKDVSHLEPMDPVAETTYVALS